MYLTKLTVMRLLLLGYLAVSLYNLVWPLWDKGESRFVASLLTMMPQSLPDGSWPGPVVEGDPTVLVTGDLQSSSPPYDKVSGRTFSGCAFARLRTYIYRPTFVGTNFHQWHLTDSKYFFGGNLRVGARWRLDPNLFKSITLPGDVTVQDSLHERIECPARGDGKFHRCQIRTLCLSPGPVSVLGVSNMRDPDAPMVMLPNMTLIDYPLFLAGDYSPAKFSEKYEASMQKRIGVYPVMVSLFLLFLASRILPFILEKEFFAGGRDIIPALLALYRQRRTDSKQRDRLFLCILLFVLPPVPLLAYVVMPFNAAFYGTVILNLAGLWWVAKETWRVSG